MSALNVPLPKEDIQAITSTWENDQYHLPLEKCKSKPQQAINSHLTKS